MRRIGVCDDEEMGLRMVAGALKDALQKEGRAGEVVLYHSPEELSWALQQGEALTALFLDICMPGIDGISLGTRLSQRLSSTLLIFVSSREDLVFQSFQARPFRFIRKASFSQDFPAVWKALWEEISRQEASKLSLPGARGPVFLRPEDILYIESFRKIQIAHTVRGEEELHASFSLLEQELAPYGFVQTHKSYLVNSRAIHSIHSGSLTLDDGTSIPIGRTRAAEVKEAFRRVVLGDSL